MAPPVATAVASSTWDELSEFEKTTNVLGVIGVCHIAIAVVMIFFGWIFCGSVCPDGHPQYTYSRCPQPNERPPWNSDHCASDGSRPIPTLNCAIENATLQSIEVCIHPILVFNAWAALLIYPIPFIVMAVAHYFQGNFVRIVHDNEESVKD